MRALNSVVVTGASVKPTCSPRPTLNFPGWCFKAVHLRLGYQHQNKSKATAGHFVSWSCKHAPSCATMETSVPGSMAGTEHLPATAAGIKRLRACDQEGAAAPHAAKRQAVEEHGAERHRVDGSSSATVAPAVTVSDALERLCKHLAGGNVDKFRKAVKIFVGLCPQIDEDNCFDFLRCLCIATADVERASAPDVAPAISSLFAAVQPHRSKFDSLPGPAGELADAMLIQFLYGNQLKTDDSFAFERACKAISTHLSSLAPDAEPEGGPKQEALVAVLTALAAMYRHTWARVGIEGVFRLAASKRLLFCAPHRAQLDTLSNSVRAKATAAGSHIPATATGSLSRFHPLMNVSSRLSGGTTSSHKLVPGGSGSGKLVDSGKFTGSRVGGSASGEIAGSGGVGGVGAYAVGATVTSNLTVSESGVGAESDGNGTQTAAPGRVEP